MPAVRISPPRRRAVLLGAIVLLVAGSSALHAETLPRVSVRTLGGRELSLPAALRHADALLVIGFTQRSERETVVWRKNAQRDFASNGRLIVYPVIVMAGIPGIFRGLIIAGIRAGYPRRAWDHFLVVSSNEARWKAAVQWQGPDRAYVLLVDRSGEIVWRKSGPFTSAGERSLSTALAKLERAAR